MPKSGVSTEWIETLEDEIAQMLTARDHVDRLRTLADLLRRRNIVTDAYYRDMRDSLDYIASRCIRGAAGASGAAAGIERQQRQRHRPAPAFRSAHGSLQPPRRLGRLQRPGPLSARERHSGQHSSRGVAAGARGDA